MMELLKTVRDHCHLAAAVALLLLGPPVIVVGVWLTTLPTPGRPDDGPLMGRHGGGPEVSLDHSRAEMSQGLYMAVYASYVTAARLHHVHILQPRVSHDGRKIFRIPNMKNRSTVSVDLFMYQSAAPANLLMTTFRDKSDEDEIVVTLQDGQHILESDERTAQALEMKSIGPASIWIAKITNHVMEDHQQTRVIVRMTSDQENTTRLRRPTLNSSISLSSSTLTSFLGGTLLVLQDAAPPSRALLLPRSTVWGTQDPPDRPKESGFRRTKRNRDDCTQCSVIPWRLSADALDESRVLYPRSLQLNYCAGDCSLFESASSLTNNAFLRAAHRLLTDDDVPRPTCTPLSYSTTQLIVRHDDGSLHFEYMDDLVVSHCGCR